MHAEPHRLPSTYSPLMPFLIVLGLFDVEPARGSQTGTWSRSIRNHPVPPPPAAQQVSAPHTRSSTSIDVLYRDRGRREAPCGANESQWVGHWERDVDDTDWDVYYARDRSPEY